MLPASAVSRLGCSNIFAGMKILGYLVGPRSKKQMLTWPAGNIEPETWTVATFRVGDIFLGLMDGDGSIDQIDHLENCKSGQFLYKTAAGVRAIGLGDKEWGAVWDMRSFRMRNKAPGSMWKTGNPRPTNPAWDKGGVEGSLGKAPESVTAR